MADQHLRRPLVKEAEGWKFSEVRLDCQTVSPIDEGWVRRPFWSE